MNCALLMRLKSSLVFCERRNSTVNVIPHELQRLRETQAVREVREGTDILYLDSRYYSPEFGLSLTPSGEMEVLDAGSVCD